MRKLVVNAYQRQTQINRNIYGHFSEHLGRCIYEGIYVGEASPIPNTNGVRNDVAQALKRVRVPVLRWPGGCFADEYHWKDGVGGKATRKKMINTNWGGVVEDNSFGTHEFMDLCRQLDCAPYINGNMGTGSVQEMQEWAEYMTFDGTSPMADWRRANGSAAPYKLPYFGVGNENWGCGGNMTAEYYAGEYRRYQTYVHNYSGNQVQKIACGPSDADYHWTEVLMREAGKYMDGLSLHHYCFSGKLALDLSETDWYSLLNSALLMDEMIRVHKGIMRRYDPQGRVGLVVDEWGAWHKSEPGSHPGFLYQQNTMRDAVLAAVTLNIFNKHSDRVRMANIAQTVNVLQALILTEGEKMLLTPTYHVFDMYKDHQDATLAASFVQQEITGGEHPVPDLHESASVTADDTLTITLANLSADKPQDIDTIIVGHDFKDVSAVILTSEMSGHNTFENPNKVAPEAYTDLLRTDMGVKFQIPPRCVLKLSLR
ncbi:MAG: alpha-N-arabinofuranosidase [Clostridiales bacterium]|jgi:alpha-N-arabinofuranosidase|nr:alpha-N-arabinofuranosidase [Clostridiales bacterium]